MIEELKKRGIGKIIKIQLWIMCYLIWLFLFIFINIAFIQTYGWGKYLSIIVGVFLIIVSFIWMIACICAIIDTVKGKEILRE
jgi:hypothetical protein